MSMLLSKLFRRLAALGGMMSMLALVVASPVLAQEIRITSPADGAEVPEGGSVRVGGEGCAPGSTVVFAYEDPGPATTAKQDGTFDALVPVPEIAVPAGNVEVTLTATCNNSQDTVRLLVVDNDAHELKIIEPANQTEVKPGQTFTVRGAGCEPGSTVTVSFFGKTQTRAKKDGSFATRVRVPRDVKVAEHVEEAGEVSLNVTCGAQANAVVLVLDVASKPARSGKQVREVPKGGVETGGGTAAGPPAALLAIGTLAAIGIAAVLLANRPATRR